MNFFFHYLVLSFSSVLYASVILDKPNLQIIMFLECFYQLVSELRFHLGKCERNPRGPSCSYRCTCWITQAHTAHGLYVCVAMQLCFIPPSLFGNLISFLIIWMKEFPICCSFTGGQSRRSVRSKEFS